MTPMIDSQTQSDLFQYLTQIISETNGISLVDTLKLISRSEIRKTNPRAYGLIEGFRRLVSLYSQDEAYIQHLLAHPISGALSDFFRQFPLKYKDEHIHLTGSLSAEFLFPRLKKLLDGPHQSLYKQKIIEVYGSSAWPIESVEDVNRLIRLKETEGFNTYLRILYLPKLILVDKQAHIDSAYHIARECYLKYNVGSIRLKFSLTRASTNSAEQIPGADQVSPEDVILGLYEGFKKFQSEYVDFNFILSPSFRKEAVSFDPDKYKNRQDHFKGQVDEIVQLLDQYSFLQDHLTDVDTVGSELDLYRKGHFNEFNLGFRKLRYRGFQIRSHHGETFHTLKKGVQAVDNAMNIWHIDTLEHGLSLGINPNFYFHRLYQKVIALNQESTPITESSSVYKELVDLDWGNSNFVLEKLLKGVVLNNFEHTVFLKSKFHTAREVEHYQHDVLNRMIQKGVTLISLPSSNNKLTGQFEDYKDHPFSWWEKKGVQLGLGTDNFITLSTNYIQEMLILLYTDPADLKITKLLMVSTGENRRPFISHLLWKMRKQFAPNM